MKKQVTTTNHQIGNTTYIVCASSSESATDSIESKIEKLILKDLQQQNNFCNDVDSSACYNACGTTLACLPSERGK